jgi:excisionase family DNA binding protein
MQRVTLADNLLTPRQVAEALQFTTARPVYRMIREGRLPAAKVGGRLLIRPSDVDEMIAAARTEPSTGLRKLERSR